MVVNRIRRILATTGVALSLATAAPSQERIFERYTIPDSTQVPAFIEMLREDHKQQELDTTDGFKLYHHNILARSYVEKYGAIEEPVVIMREDYQAPNRFAPSAFIHPIIKDNEYFSTINDLDILAALLSRTEQPLDRIEEFLDTTDMRGIEIFDGQQSTKELTDAKDLLGIVQILVDADYNMHRSIRLTGGDYHRLILLEQRIHSAHPELAALADSTTLMSYISPIMDEVLEGHQRAFPTLQIAVPDSVYRTIAEVPNSVGEHSFLTDEIVTKQRNVLDSFITVAHEIGHVVGRMQEHTYLQSVEQMNQELIDRSEVNNLRLTLIDELERNGVQNRDIITAYVSTIRSEEFQAYLKREFSDIDRTLKKFTSTSDPITHLEETCAILMQDIFVRELANEHPDIADELVEYNHLFNKEKFGNQVNYAAPLYFAHVLTEMHGGDSASALRYLSGITDPSSEPLYVDFLTHYSMHRQLFPSILGLSDDYRIGRAIQNNLKRPQGHALANTLDPNEDLDQRQEEFLSLLSTMYDNKLRSVMQPNNYVVNWFEKAMHDIYNKKDDKSQE